MKTKCPNFLRKIDDHHTLAIHELIGKNEVYLETNPTAIGELNADGTSIVVGIDESKFFHRKHETLKNLIKRFIFPRIYMFSNR